MEFVHYSVMKKEAIENLNISPEGIYVDCTLGGGGHSLEILKRLTTGRLIAFDKDSDAINFSKELLKKYSDKLIIVNSNFKDISRVLNELNIQYVDGILADLGVSSYQLDTADRGFSYMHDGRLDMRMDKLNPLDAYKVVNEYSEEDLRKILFEFGEEQHAKSIAKKIVTTRQKKPIETTFELKEIIKSCYPIKLKDKPGINGKTFQAVRIEVNKELDDLISGIEDMIASLKSKGRLVVITFQPLEDKIVKKAFKIHSTDCLCPPKIPKCVCNHKADIKLITKKPIIPSQKELDENSRSASAKMRVIEKL